MPARALLLNGAAADLVLTRGIRNERQHHFERAAFPLTITGDPNLTLVMLDDLLHQGQAQPGAAETPAQASFHLIETFEDPLLLVHGDTNTGVMN